MAKKHEQTEPQKPNSSSPAAALSDGELESVTGGAKDYLLVIDGIKGEVGEHKAETDVLSFSWGVSQSGTTALKK